MNMKNTTITDNEKYLDTQVQLKISPMQYFKLRSTRREQSMVHKSTDCGEQTR